MKDLLMKHIRVKFVVSCSLLFMAQMCFAQTPSAADLRAQGDKSFAAGNYDAAMKSFQAAANLEPAFVGGQYRIAQTALQLKQPGVGLEALDAITLLDSKLASNSAITKLRQDLEAVKATGGAAVPIPVAVPAPNPAVVEKPKPSRDPRLEITLRACTALIGDAQEELKAGRTKQAQIYARQVCEKIEEQLAQPEQKDLDVWRLAGLAAIVINDGHLAACSSWNISKLEPTYLNNPQLAALMTQLEKIPVSREMKALAENSWDYRRLCEELAKDSTIYNKHEHAIALLTGKGVPRCIHLALLELDGISKHTPGNEEFAGLYEGMAADDLGCVYAFGIVGVMERDPVRAEQYFRDSAEINAKKAEREGRLANFGLHSVDELGDLLLGGASNRVAMSFDRRQQGFFLVGDMNQFQGLLNVEKNDAAAEAWYVREADVWPKNAESAAFFYEEVKHDVKSKFDYMLKAADAGNAEAMYNVGVALWNEQPRRINEAIEWFQKAARAGNESAKKALKEEGKSW